VPILRVVVAIGQGLVFVKDEKETKLRDLRGDSRKGSEGTNHGDTECPEKLHMYFGVGMTENTP
jgi:hypothetical protein